MLETIGWGLTWMGYAKNEYLTGFQHRYVEGTGPLLSYALNLQPHPVMPLTMVNDDTCMCWLLRKCGVALRNEQRNQ